MNKRSAWLLALGVLLPALFVVVQVLVIVREGETAVRTTFGRPDTNALAQAGLYTRWPWPVQRIHRFDARTQSFEGASEQTLTRDGRAVIVGLYAGWRIADPVLFLQRVGTVEDAQRSLGGLLGHYKNAILGQTPFDALVNSDPGTLQLETIERRILEAAAPEARSRYGIVIANVGIRHLGLPEAIAEKVFERMRAERKTVAERLRSEGDSEGVRLRAEADSARDRTLAEAEADARRTRAEGDAAAAESYEVFEKDPELAIFLRKIDVLERTLNEKSTVVLGADTPPFDLLVATNALPLSVPAPMPGAKPAPASAPAPTPMPPARPAASAPAPGPAPSAAAPAAVPASAPAAKPGAARDRT